MMIEEGKFYKTRAGRKVGPIIVMDDVEPIFCVESGQLGGTWYDHDGKYSYGGEDDRPEDLIAEWTEGPVRTVTRREVVEGSYGRLDVRSDNDGYVSLAFMRTPLIGGVVKGDRVSLDAGELKAAAAVLLELAGALE